MTKQADITIVGGGMVGLASACLLAKQGLQIDLVDNRQEIDPTKIDRPKRVSALNLASQNLLESLGVWQPLEQNHNISPYRQMRVWDQGSDAQVNFNAADFGQPHLGHIVENSRAGYAMQQRLKQNYNVCFHFNTTVTALQTTQDNISISTQSNDRSAILNSQLVIAADGSHSTIRSLAEIDVNRENFHQEAIVATLTCGNHQNTAWQVFTPTGPIALLPLSHNQVSLVWSCDESHLDKIKENTGAMSEQLNAHFAEKVGPLTLLDTPMSFPLNNQHAERYIADRLALIGDAAHATHPLAGLGANIGLLDAAALAEVIENARTNGKAFHQQSTLRRFERWRKGENSLVLTAMKGFKTAFGHTAAPIQTLRQTGLNLADNVNPLKSNFAQYAMGLNGDLPAICREHT